MDFSHNSISKPTFSHLDVPLDVFLRFNKMKEIASGIDEIQKALESSEMLELSSDRQSVRRVTEIKRKDNIDECTVYVVSKKHCDTFIHSFVFINKYLLSSGSLTSECNA